MTEFRGKPYFREPIMAPGSLSAGQPDRASYKMSSHSETSSRKISSKSKHRACSACNQPLPDDTPGDVCQNCSTTLCISCLQVGGPRINWMKLLTLLCCLQTQGKQNYITAMASSTFRQDFVNISDLHPNLSRPSIIGIVIGKTDVKGFPDRKNIGSERYTFSFTVRDSPSAFINASCWGREEYIRSLSESFRIGDCVIIENPLVQTKDVEKEEKFNPSTPSYYKLLISEVHSLVKICSRHDTESSLLSLLPIPPKDPNDYYSLGDIVANGQSLNGKIINILAAVRWVGEMKTFTTSDKRKGQRCEVKLFDDTVDSFAMICWDNETIQLAQTWIPRETVLFASEIRINYDSFRNSMVATVVSKTIFTTNPDMPEAYALLRYARDCAENGAFVEENEDVFGDSIKSHTAITQSVIYLKAAPILSAMKLPQTLNLWSQLWICKWTSPITPGPCLLTYRAARRRIHYHAP